MILTVTMNPSVDIAYLMDNFYLDEVNRVKQVRKTAGGKGLNVTRVLKQLNSNVKATGVIGGHTGEFISDELTRQEISHHFFQVNGESRNSIAILHGQSQTEILEEGPLISDREQKGFLEIFSELIIEGSTVTISGSLSKGLPTNFYNRLIQIANRENCRVLLDTSGKALKESLRAKIKPTLIKPNETEIAELMGLSRDAVTIDSLKSIMNEPLFEGTQWIIVSMGAEGAFAKYNTQFYEVTIPKVPVKNPVGSGDATLAGLAYAIDRNLSPEQVLAYGMTSGILNVMEEATGCINPELFDDYFKKIQVKEV